MSPWTMAVNFVQDETGIYGTIESDAMRVILFVCAVDSLRIDVYISILGR
jgi:hypothetical protein